MTTSSLSEVSKTTYYQFLLRKKKKTVFLACIKTLKKKKKQATTNTSIAHFFSPLSPSLITSYQPLTLGGQLYFQIVLPFHITDSLI